ncbi:MAG TPA: hypothetical protein VGL40_03635 [Bacillota bacterium]
MVAAMDSLDRADPQDDTVDHELGELLERMNELFAGTACSSRSPNPEAEVTVP